jgi:hypothetical protein
MEIPESIDNLTTIATPDPFNSRPIEQKMDINKILDILKYNISYTDFNSVEEGLSFYKRDTQTDSAIIKNFLLLYLEAYKKSLNTSSVTDELKPVLVRAFSENINSMVHSLDIFGELLTTLNMQKNILDVNRISYIMLGYAINIIKKLHNA